MFFCDVCPVTICTLTVKEMMLVLSTCHVCPLREDCFLPGYPSSSLTPMFSPVPDFCGCLQLSLACLPISSQVYGSLKQVFRQGMQWYIAAVQYIKRINQLLITIAISRFYSKHGVVLCIISLLIVKIL